MQKEIPDPRKFEGLSFKRWLRLQLEIDDFVIFYGIVVFIVIMMMAFGQAETIPFRLSLFINVLLIPFALLLNLLSTRILLIRLWERDLISMDIFKSGVLQRWQYGTSLIHTILRMTNFMLSEKVRKVFSLIGLIVGYTLSTGIFLFIIFWFSLQELL